MLGRAELALGLALSARTLPAPPWHLPAPCSAPDAALQDRPFILNRCPLEDMLPSVGHGLLRDFG